MTYSRPPNSLVGGMAVTVSPNSHPPGSAGVLFSTVSAHLATTSTPGVVQVGSGLSITPAGVLSATGSGPSGTFRGNVTLTSVNYTVLPTDFYIGATRNGITITLPPGVLGTVYIVKNQCTGNITLRASSGQTINNSSSKTLGDEDSVIVIFDGSRWNIV